MAGILIIGLNKFSSDIITIFKKSNFMIYGYDFDKNNINNFREQNLIVNSSFDSLEFLIKSADMILLNIPFEKYKQIFYYFSSIRDSCIIFDINSYKKDNSIFKSYLKEKYNNFIPTNFFYFPNEVIFNYTNENKISSILRLKDFFKTLNIKIKKMTIQENNNFFLSLYYIPFILEKTFFELEENHFFKKKDFFYNDLFFYDIYDNRDQIVKIFENYFIPSLDLLEYNENIQNLFNLDIDLLEHPKDISKKIKNDKIILKIIIEKIYIMLFGKMLLKIDNKDLFTFDYIKYDTNSLIKYVHEEDVIFQKILFIMEEKFSTIISTFNSGYINFKKFKQIIELFK